MIKFFKSIPKFFKEVGEELKKVNWSSRRDLIDAALLVVAMISVLTIYIFAVDLALAKAMEHLLK
jgi:preprotein translocase subunit SecE